MLTTTVGNQTVGQVRLNQTISRPNVLETALNAELTEHLGHEHGGAPISENMRNGTRVKTVFTEIGPVEIEVPRDRDGSFEPVIVPKRKRRRLDGVDQIVLSLTARGLMTGEIAAHFDGGLWGEGLQGHDQSDHGESHRGAGRVVELAVGCVVSGDLRRRDRGESP